MLVCDMCAAFIEHDRWRVMYVPEDEQLEQQEQATYPQGAVLADVCSAYCNESFLKAKGRKPKMVAGVVINDH